MSPSRQRSKTALSVAQRNSNNFAVVGPNEKFSNSQLYRLRQPVQEQSHVPKTTEFAILGKNEKLQENKIYPLRKSFAVDTSQVCIIYLGERWRLSHCHFFRMDVFDRKVKVTRAEFKL
jgi:hypothetical protein